MASASFRESMSSLGWSRREADAPVSTAAPSVMDRVSNLFGAGGYVRLPISETNPGAPLPAPTRREEEEGFFARKYIYLVLCCQIADRPLGGSLYLEVYLKQSVFWCTFVLVTRSLSCPPVTAERHNESRGAL